MIWIYVILYFIVGFTFLLIGQVLNQKGYDDFDIYETDYMFLFRIVAMLTVILWPVVAIFYIMYISFVSFIPWLIMSAYKLFVGIVFGTIALFKKVRMRNDTK